MKTLRYLSVALALALAGSTVAWAAVPPQFGSGPPIYKVNGGSVANANCGDTLTFAILAHNVNNTGGSDDLSELQNVVAKATLPSGEVTSFASTLTLSASNAESVSQSVTVNLAQPATIQLVSGPAGITQGGASLGHVRKELNTSFQAKVHCPTPAAVVTPTPAPGKGAPAPVTPVAAVPLAQTGPEDFALLGAFLTSLLATSYLLSRPGRAPAKIKK